MTADKKKDTEEKRIDEFTMEDLHGLSNEQIVSAIVKQLSAKAKSNHNRLTYSDMTDYLENLELDKNVIDEIYDSLMGQDIEIDLEMGRET